MDVTDGLGMLGGRPQPPLSPPQAARMACELETRREQDTVLVGRHRRTRNAPSLFLERKGWEASCDATRHSWIHTPLSSIRLGGSFPLPCVPICRVLAAKVTAFATQRPSGTRRRQMRPCLSQDASTGKGGAPLLLADADDAHVLVPVEDAPDLLQTSEKCGASLWCGAQHRKNSAS